MHLRSLIYIIITTSFLSRFISAEPTVKPEWTSTVGSVLSARAISLSDEQITLVSAQEKMLPLTNLSSKDQAFLKENFETSVQALFDDLTIDLLELSTQGACQKLLNLQKSSFLNTSEMIA